MKYQNHINRKFNLNRSKNKLRTFYKFKTKIEEMKIVMKITQINVSSTEYSL